MMRSDEDGRREQKAWQERLSQGDKLRVMLKGQLVPPADPVTVDGVTKMTPTTIDVWICILDEETESGQFRKLIVTDEVITVAVYDPTLPSLPSNSTKVGLYGHIQLIDGTVELTWVGCQV